MIKKYICKGCNSPVEAHSISEIMANRKLCGDCRRAELVRKPTPKKKLTVTGSWYCKGCGNTFNYHPYSCECSGRSFGFRKGK